MSTGSLPATAEPQISVVLPCYNEADNLEPMLAELRAALEPLGRSYEVIYVDDGSTDDSADRLMRLQAQHACVRYVRHKRNFGQSAAFHTGFQIVRGQVIITLDADLQNDPADIPRLLALVETEGADAVCGIRQKRRDSWTKRASSRVANRVRDRVLRDGIHDAGCAYRVIRREALEQLPGFRALHRFLPTILKWHGFKVIEAPVNHRPRTMGVSKYGIGNRLFVGLADLVGMRWYRARHFPPDRLARDANPE
jgi:dolichol-phosphate mannosyltransferase